MDVEGRVDDADGSASDELGPTPLQEQMYPCAVQVGEIPCAPSAQRLRL
jgi:hypothetical protein